jgi:hypothetical protein
VKQLVQDRLEPSTAAQFLVKEDAGLARVVEKRPAACVTLELCEAKQPTLAVDSDVVIVCHGLPFRTPP